jgi:DNA repair exonuclease SbcCD ATPase subunit
MANESLILRIGADVSSLKGEFAKIDNQMNQFRSGVQRISGTISAVFGGIVASAVANAAFEVSKLAAESEGVETAFNKLQNSAKLMHDLKEATHGTVSELDLMKRAVQFSNFNLSLKELPKLLEFATLRAQQTGQSVDYLVDSIVTGLGRKSVLILDNLGLSSAMINEEVSKTGDFMKAVGNIVDVELGKMGNVIENNLTKTERLSASWTNYKVAVGEAANGTGLLGTAIDSLTTGVDLAASKNLSFWEKFAALIGGPGAKINAVIKDTVLNQKKLSEEQKKSEQVVQEVDRAFSEWGDNLEGYKKAITQHIYYQEILAEITRRLTDEEKKKAAGIENIANLTSELTVLQQMQQTLTGSALAKTNQEIKSIEEKIKALRELGTVEAANRRTSFMSPVALQDPGTQSLMAGLDGFKSRINSIVQPLKLAKGEMLSFQEAWAKLGYAGIDATAMINEGLVNMTVGLSEALGDLASGAGSMNDIGAVLLGAIGGMAVQLGQLAIATGIAVAGIKKALLSLNPVAAIAGGVALVALGKMVSNRAAAIAKGGNGGGGSSFTGGGVSSSTPLTDGRSNLRVSGVVSVSGTQLNIVLANQSRVDNRTGRK